MRNVILILFAVLFTACGSVKQVPVETKTETHYVDSLVIRDSIIFYPRERVVDIVPQYDTLKLSIEAAESSAWIDTSFHILRGEIRAKNGQRTRIVERVKTEYRDSIVTKEVPVPYEVEKVRYPKSYWLWLAISLLSITALILKLRK